MDRPTFSVITCTKNSERYLKECLSSVVRQTWRDFEHIFVDGFSTDKTIEIIEQYSQENPDVRVKLIKAKPKGVANAMNVGLNYAEGEIIHFLHSDDYYYSKDSLEKVVRYFQTKPDYKIIIGNNIYLWRGRVYLFRENNLAGRFLRLTNQYSHPNTFVKKEVFDRHGLFDESFQYCMDREFLLRVIYEEKTFFVDDNFTVFRSHPDSLSSHVGLNKLNIFKETLRISLKYQRR